ncbi:pantoate--beta-alanine ligase [Paenibacillus sp.]|jgi:pantoate--beta-alanine ligase|uniref:pantoate--beta-alanine ligase n=1 Tax=Paenibacillus sp. TaxID=58172 RepID=UPI002820DF84|nr:pantoate--beta-alanine ligase [Paenibacillus sp.]MDR0271567.1 pantoate--beta-alanine ligase [Paenibacillus sp.]
MKAVRTISELREHIQHLKNSSDLSTVGLVPTMGYLHQGHASLISAARGKSDIVVVSIFVNPIQFGPGEDFETYPRDEDRDLAVAEAAGADLVFLPSVDVMYPKPTKTKVAVSEVTSGLCGASRPGHFDGVTTVVSKLFHIVQPNHAFFGMKDAQQVAVIEQMVFDLNFNVTIVPCPIIREEDGLALSSRNVYLSPEERSQALVLSRSLRETKNALEIGQIRTAGEARELLVKIIGESSIAVIDYTEVMAFPELSQLADGSKVLEQGESVLMALAVNFGKTRLIDNCLIHPKGE